jgi:hypothetical protein
MSWKPLLLGLIPVLGLAALTYQLMVDGEQPTMNTPGPLSPPPSPADSLPQAATGRIAPTRSAANKQQTGNRHKLTLPNGTFVDALNGAVDSPPMSDYWGPFDWSPIIGIERSSAGVDWYKHADGSYSTTEMVMRSDLGRKVAMTRVAHPGPAPATTSPR